MKIFLDEIKKIYYIMAPKCGNTTIAEILNTGLHTEPDLSNINNPKYKKVIILRKNLVERFLSGFYEDLFNNTCYNDIDITFNDYLLFLYDCFKKKHSNLDNMEVYNKKNVAIWFGNCSNVTLPITNESGQFVSHIQSQYTAIHYIIELINHNENVLIVEINKLYDYLHNKIRKNVKEKITLENTIFSSMTLSYIKNNRIIVDGNSLSNKQKELILEIYKEDEIFIKNLEKKFCEF